MIYNIFSRKKQKTNKTKISKIIIDIHEKDSLIPVYLSELKIEFSLKSLKVGDYLVSDIIIERKTISDLISSLISKRLINQLKEIKSYKKKFLILEGDLQEEKINFNPNAIRGLILSVILDFNIPIIYTKDQKDTAKFLAVLAKRTKNKEITFHSRKGKSEEESIKYILESFHGIGPATSKKLLNKYKTLRNIFNLNQEELKKEIGSKADIFEILDKF